jgi:hypothetical protein
MPKIPFLQENRKMEKNFIVHKNAEKFLYAGKCRKIQKNSMNAEKCRKMQKNSIKAS